MEERFATELLHEVKMNGRRWFVIAMVELGIILLLTGIFVWYISLPVDEITTTTEQSIDGSDNTDVRLVGGDYNESKDGEENNDKTQGNEK